MRVKSGELIRVEPFTWEFDRNDPGCGKLTQYPLRLAYAMTIHKAQGLTLDAAYLDIRAAREPGQAYVAVSRVRTLAGLHFKDYYIFRKRFTFHQNGKTMQAGMGVRQYKNLVETVVLCPALPHCVEQYRCVRAI